MSTTLFIRLLGLLLLTASLAGAFYFHIIQWYVYFVIGGTCFLSSINEKQTSSCISLLKKSPLILLLLYLAYLGIAFLISFVGKSWLGLWEYHPSLSGLDLILLYALGYPFGFFMLYETWLFFRPIFPHFWPCLLLTFFLSAFLHEYPNTFVYAWRYTLPVVSYEFHGIHIFVILGWEILTAIPIVITSLLVPNQRRY